ncbi:MAG: DUF3576 domain-containing protein [Rhodospirillaceae bacterium]
MKPLILRAWRPPFEQREAPVMIRLSSPVSAFLVLAFTLALGACANSKAVSQEEVERKEMYKHGSILGGEGGLDLLGTKRREDAQNQGGGLGVNSFLWRGSLDTLAFMPIASADPFGGVILTDWYAPADTPNERYKVNVYILDRQLRADALKVSVFRQQRDSSGTWRDGGVGSDTATKLEDAILTRARQLRIAQKGE